MRVDGEFLWCALGALLVIHIQGVSVLLTLLVKTSMESTALNLCNLVSDANIHSASVLQLFICISQLRAL